MTALFLVGDVHQRQAELIEAGEQFDLIITSPPFLALRSYLPDDHPDKHLEIGSEATPAEYLDVLLALTAQWRQLLAPHGSIAIELGDTYAGSGGAGGDYNPEKLRQGQPRFDGSGRRGSNRVADDGTTTGHWGRGNGIPRPSEKVVPTSGNGWPLDKSLTGIPTLYTWSLAYGRNLLTGQPSPAGQWRIRNLKPWIRTNPPVGSLGDKERPATSYITVATLARNRWFDLDAVRTTMLPHTEKYNGGTRPTYGERGGQGTVKEMAQDAKSNPAGAPPLDWWRDADAVIDAVLETEGRKGVHVRRALERAGILPRHLDALDISPKGYAGAHYAVWPPELVRQLVDEMCPRRVCTTCGEPSRRIVGDTDEYAAYKADNQWDSGGKITSNLHRPNIDFSMPRRTPLGWSDCGHNTWRPGRILDPFVGSGTTLAVATGMARDAVGIDLDPRNAHLAEQRCGMFLEVDWGHLEPTTELPPPQIVAAVNEELL